MIDREWSCWNPLKRKPAHLEEKYILTVGLAQITEVDGSCLSQLSYDGGDSTVSSNNLFQVGLQLTIIFVVD